MSLVDLPIGQHRVRCPACGRGDRDKTMSVKVDADGAVFHCHRCQAEGNERSARPGRVAARAMPAPASPLTWSSRADAIWGRTTPLRGSLGQVYLERRGCALPPADTALRFLPAVDRHPPALCAQITDAVTGEPMSLHFTRLAHDGRGKAGTDADKTMLARHRKKGGVIRLWPQEAVTTGLAIAEGIETALATAHAYTPVWACLDAGNLGDFPVLAGIETLVVIADHDDAGLEAAEVCGRRWQDAGREVLIVVPPNRGADMADVVAVAA